MLCKRIRITVQKSTVTDILQQLRFMLPSKLIFLLMLSDPVQLLSCHATTGLCLAKKLLESCQSSVPLSHSWDGKFAFSVSFSLGRASNQS